MLIFAILTGIAFFGISIYTAQANETRVASDLGTFEVAIKDYMLNNPGACSDGTLNPVGLNHYLTKENTLALDEADPNKDDLGTEISVAAGVKNEAVYKKLSVLEDPWGHQYRVVIRNNADRTTEEGEYGAKGTDRAFIYVYSMGKDGKGAANDTKQDDSVLCVQYSDGEVYSHTYLPSDGKNQAVTAPAYTYWNKDENGKHSVMKDSIFAVGAVDPSKAPGKESSESGGSGNPGSGSSDNPGETTIRSGKIPAGGIYTVAASRDVLSGDNGDSFPDTPAKRDKYEEGDYIYTYDSGRHYETDWYVAVKDKAKTEYGTILSGISGKPVTDLEYTFSSCTKLTKAPKIPDSVTWMYGTFSGCIALETAPVIPSSVRSMYYTFRNCKSLTTAPALPSRVTNIESTFEYCTSLTTAPTIPSSVTSMSYTFRGCTALTTVPPIPDSVTFLNGTFYGCKSLVTAPAIPDKATYLCSLFSSCTSLTTAPTIPDGVWAVSSMFSDCTSLKTYTGSTDEDGNFSGFVIPDGATHMSRMFDSCSSLTVAPKVPNSMTDMEETFKNCTSLTVAPDISGKVKNMNSAFKGCTALTSAPNMSNAGSVTDMTSSFEGCTSLVTAPAIPSKVANMKYTFSGCTALTTAPDMSNAESVTNMFCTFDGCTALVTPPTVPSGVTNMFGTFKGCTALVTPPTIPSSVTDMGHTFRRCTSLATAPMIPNSVTSMWSTFEYCTSLTGTIEINANPTRYDFCFSDTSKPIVLTGSSTMLNELSGRRWNVTVRQ